LKEGQVLQPFFLRNRKQLCVQSASPRIARNRRGLRFFILP
jgi:hypothetical protein